MNNPTPGNSKTLIASESFQSLLCLLSNESKIARIFCRGFLSQKRTGKSRFFSQNLQFNWIAWRETSGLISYYPTNRGEQPINEDGKWVRKGRQDMRISAWAKTALSPKILKKLTDDDFNRFSTLFKREEKSGELKCYILSGAENINDIYAEEEFDNGFDCPNGSCMFNEEVGEFYEKMGADIAVCRDGNNKLVARAIIWPEIEFLTLKGKFYKLLDRVYSTGPEYQSFMIEWAKSQGFVTKKNQNASDKNYFRVEVNNSGVNGNYFFYEDIKLKAPARIGCVNFHPYLDTFRRLSPGECNNEWYFHNDEVEDEFEGWLYNDTSGDREELNPHEGQVKDVDGNWIDKDTAIEVDGDYYEESDDRICKCHRDECYYLSSEIKVVNISSSRTIHIHESYVEDME